MLLLFSPTAGLPKCVACERSHVGQRSETMPALRQMSLPVSSSRGLRLLLWFCLASVGFKEVIPASEGGKGNEHVGTETGSTDGNHATSVLDSSTLNWCIACYTTLGFAFRQIKSILSILSRPRF